MNDNTDPKVLEVALREEEAARAEHLKAAEAAAARIKELTAANERLSRENTERVSVLNRTTTQAVENSRRSTDMWKQATDTLMKAGVVGLVLVVVGCAIYLLRPSDTATKTSIASTSVLSVDDLDGKIDGRIKKAIAPVVDDVVLLKRDTKALKDSFGEAEERSDTRHKEQKRALEGIAKLLEDMKTGKTTPPATTPAPAAPAAPALSALGQQRLALIKRECLPEDQNVDLNDTVPLSDDAFNAHIAHCKANKLAQQRQVSPPPAAGRQQVAQGDPQAEPEMQEEDEQGDQAQADGQPVVQQAGYGGPQYGRPGYGAPHHGARRGGPRCPPGSNFNPQYGKCIGTTLRHIPLHPEARAAFPTCQSIETREVWKNGRLTQQQRGIGCRRPVGAY